MPVVAGEIPPGYIGLMRRLSLAGLFATLGLLLPLGFHAVGLGKAFLPMHIPVLLTGIYLGWRWGVTVGVVVPLLSGALTGMPSFAPPVALMMMVELPLYGASVAVLYRSLRTGAFLAVAGAAFAGRLTYGATGYLLFPLFGWPAIGFLYPVTAGLVSGLPGILVQLTVVPLLVSRFTPEGYRQAYST